MQYVTTLTVFFMLFFYYALPTGLLCLLEHFLAKLESPWPGRVLPILSAVHSICWTLVVLFNLAGPASPALFLIPLAMLVVFNLPTLLFLPRSNPVRLKVHHGHALITLKPRVHDALEQNFLALPGIGIIIRCRYQK